MSPAPKRRWFQFSLRTMFVVVTVFGAILFSVHYTIRSMEARRGRLRYEDVLRAYHADLVLDAYVYQASDDWLIAELRVPFSSPTRAATAHLKRIEAIRDEFKVIMGGYDRDPEGRLGELNMLCDQARERLRTESAK